jgi:transcriptional/translational regulatory protein YebC/TACO1
MADHSKWSIVKHIKGDLDQERGKLFSRLAEEISVAAKLGGDDPGANPRLRTAILAMRVRSTHNASYRKRNQTSSMTAVMQSD